MDANQIQNLFASNVRQLLVDADLDYDKLYEKRSKIEEILDERIKDREELEIKENVEDDQSMPVPIISFRILRDHFLQSFYFRF